MPNGVGLYFALLQLAFTLTWTVYVIFLPRLAAQAGLPKSAIVWVLLLDQLVFMLADLAMGVMADRVSRVVGRLGRVLATVTIASCALFVALPHVAAAASPALLLAVTLAWTATSSALRAPPLALLGKHAARPAVPWLCALSLFGTGLAGALAPYLTIALRDVDPRLPFALSSASLAIVTLALAWAERRLASSTTAPAAAPLAPAASHAGFLVAMLLAAVAFQVHFSMNSAPRYLRFATAGELPYLMPVFWIGFNLTMLPASVATRRWGGLVVAATGAALAALAALASTIATSLQALVAMQLIAGGAWGCVMMSAVTAAIAIGHVGREGAVTGALSAMLALATASRFGLVAFGVERLPDAALMLAWMPVIAWGVGGVLLARVAAVRAARAATPVATG